jgi:predicted MPP superfamily phosphohydrolase
MLLLSVMGALVLACLTLVHIYRGGTTLNDHIVAAVVSGTHAVYPALAWGAAASDSPAAAWVAGLGLVANVGVWGLFFVLDRRREVGALRGLALLSQPAHAFALWTGLLLLMWGVVHGVALVVGPTAPEVLQGHWFWPPPVLLVLPALATAWGCGWTLLFSNRRTQLRIPGGRPVRIVHLSDLHASPVMTGPDLTALVLRANAEDPDLVVITGDLLMPFYEAEHGYLLDALAQLHAPTFAVPGNHDLPVGETLGRELEALGIRWLVDASARLELEGGAVEVVGMDFRWRDTAGHLAEVLVRCPPVPDVDLRLLLVHDPRTFVAVPSGRFDLVLSGHTHGGQLGLDLPWLRLTPLGLLGAFDGGHFTRGDTHLYVHRGNWHTGWPPRMGIAGELAVIDVGRRP